MNAIQHRFDLGTLRSSRLLCDPQNAWAVHRFTKAYRRCNIIAVALRMRAKHNMVILILVRYHKDFQQAGTFIDVRKIVLAATDQAKRVG